MSVFEILFGIKESDIKKTCILMPLAARSTLEAFGVKDLSRGKLYSAANSEHFSLVRTGIGTHLLGDAVLYLDKTSCENIVLFGSCGLVKAVRDMAIGGLASPFESLACESFTQVLEEKIENCGLSRADESLFNELMKHDKNGLVKKARCVTFGSLKMEKEKLRFFAKRDIDIVDMECSALFSAARHIKKRAVALFYITDNVTSQPFYKPLPTPLKIGIMSSINYAIETIRVLAEDLSKK